MEEKIGNDQIVYKKTGRLIKRKIGSAAVLVPLQPKDFKNQCIFSLEGIGGNIWELVDGKKTIGEILEMLFQEFQVEKSQLSVDVSAFLEQLEKIEGIERC